MSNYYRILLVPGGGGIGPNHWMNYWMQSDLEAQIVEQDNWHGGRMSDWIAKIDKYIQQSDRPTIVVAHSLGNIAFAHWAAENTNAAVKAAVFVAPADVDADWSLGNELYSMFKPIPMAAINIPSLLVTSTNDPYISGKRARAIAKSWGSRLKNIGDQGHIGSDSLLKDWPEGRQMLSDLTKQI